MADNAIKLKIGIPRALFYYNFFPLYKTFFESIGATVVISDLTNKAVLNAGLRSSINELCLPIKLLYGHVLNLKGKVDYVFLPYIINIDRVSYICPKLIAAPDLVKANFDEPKLLTVDIDMNSLYSSIFSSLSEVSMKVSINPIKIVSAYNRAVAAQKRFESYVQKGLMFDEAISLLSYPEKSKRVKDALDRIAVKTRKGNERMTTIAVIGHSYIFNDEYISSGLIRKLKAKGITVLTSDMVSEKIIKKKISVFEKIPHWFLGNRVLGAAMYFSEKKDVDGIIYITPFGCSSDSLIRECIDAKVVGKKPFMAITVDEHSGDAGQLTRLEAFLDMLERRRLRRKSGNSAMVKDSAWVSLRDVQKRQR